MKAASLRGFAKAVMHKEKDGELIPFENGEYIKHGKLKVKCGTQTILVHTTEKQVHDILLSLVKWLRKFL